jgi:hypothetical protein
MPGVTREQIDKAKQVDILDYLLRHEPDNLVRRGSICYLKDHDSLEISNGLWHWHSRGIGGKNVVDYLVKVRGYGFVDAVRRLSGDMGYNVIHTGKPPAGLPESAARKPLALPCRNGDNERVIAYLQRRGIAKPLIQDCVRWGTVYESYPYHNCVFVGYDEAGKARYATIRGTGGGFKRDAQGSDKGR